jgi:hypothetical protein
MEKPAPAPAAAEKKPEDGKEAKPRPNGTIVKVGTADFSAPAK